MSIVNLTDSNYENEVLKADIPVLVDFWAEWCRPCLNLMPIFEEIAKEMEGKVKFAKMNVEGQESPTQLKVKGLPTLYFYIGGEIKAQTYGSKTKSELLEFINSSLAEDS